MPHYVDRRVTISHTNDSNGDSSESCPACAAGLALPLIAPLLATAQAAHQRYRTLHLLSKNTDEAGMRGSVQEAYDALRQALDADHDLVDPAWTSFRNAMNGVAVQMLLAFYSRYLELDKVEATA